ncbi:MAG: hypothetical protein ABI642_05645 [Polaromonas sp.]
MAHHISGQGCIKQFAALPIALVVVGASVFAVACFSVMLNLLQSGWLTSGIQRLSFVEE